MSYVDVHVLVDKDATVARVETHDAAGHLLKVTGAAKRNPADEYNADIGYELALGRALVNMGRALIDNASVKVQQADAAAKPEQQWRIEFGPLPAPWPQRLYVESRRFATHNEAHSYLAEGRRYDKRYEAGKVVRA